MKRYFIIATMLLSICISVSANKAKRFIQIGKASWYGKKFQGHRTTSGERYDMHGFTAAHRSLPFGTLIRVTNLRNHKSVVVRINDRGPWMKGRILDLSFAAAKALDLTAYGVDKVRLEVLTPVEVVEYLIDNMT